MNFKRLEADLKRVRDYVDMAGAGEHGWRDSESLLCMSRLCLALPESHRIAGQPAGLLGSHASTEQPVTGAAVQ